ncbi:MAG: branched-chain amino acid transporter ATPase/permease [Ilumatobacteraceae bacterium]|nr:branched-chain amino acid transporter ATPase/permease [Ilumatobacteraceae bacterium]
MSDVLPFIITGMITGIIYGLAGSGLVLTFKTSGIFNFGHGAVLTASVLVFYWLHITLTLDWKIAFAVSVFLAGPMFGLVMELVARRLARQRTNMKIVGTVGLMVMVPAICLLFYPASSNGLKVKRFLPFSNRARYKWRILDVNVFGDQLLTAAIAIVAVIGLYILFRFTRLGSSMRAAVDDPDLLDLQGTNPVRVRRLAWMLGCMFASLSGVLIVPLVGLQPYTLTFLATYAFGAAAIGGFASIPITFIGGLLVGVAQDVVGYVVSDRKWTTLDGLPDALPFVILFLVLLVLPKAKLAPKSSAEARPPLQWKGPPELRIAVGVLVVGALALVPTFAGTKLSFFTFGLCQAILILSLGLLVKTSGQVSLCQATFAGISAVAFSQFTIGLGIPWLPALFLAGLVAVPVGALVALPAIRLHGIYLALATFGFGILMQRLFFPQTWMFFTFSGSRKVRSPFGTTSPTARYFVVLLALVLVAGLIVVISQSRLGRVLRGMSDTQTAVSTLGLSINVTKIIVFCISAFIAGIGGIMYGMALTNIDGSTQAFQPFNSLVLIAILTLAAFREPWYAVIAGVTAVIPGFFDGARTPQILNLGFGFFAILVAMQGGHPQMVPALQQFFGRFGRRRSNPPDLATVGAVGDAPSAAPIAGRPTPVTQATAHAVPGLEVQRLRVKFGGLVAVEDVTLVAPLGAITGLIGPNGAGKTTTFNACSGINRDVGGRILFKGAEVSTRPAAERARMGLGRTFQRMELCDSLTVFDNVALGNECAAAGRRILGQIAAPRREKAATLAAATDAIALCGIGQLVDQQAGALSTGERRLVELARCLAGPFELLLLDEPSSGLDRAETSLFADVLERVVAERGCGILLVEHDMSLVLRVCSNIFVLDFGQLIFEGAPGDVAASPVVRSAYLGAETEEIREFEQELA